MVNIGIAAIGLQVVRLIINLTEKQDFVTLADGAISITDSTLSVLDKRRGERSIEEMADGITQTCIQILDGANVSEKRKNAIVSDYVAVLS